MNCTEAKYMMPLYWSNELDAKAMAEFEQHLEDCAACAREAQLQQSFDDVLRNAFAEQQVDEQRLRERIWQQLRSDVQPHRRPLFGWIPMRFTAIAALIFIAIGSGLLYVTTTRRDMPLLYHAAIMDHIDDAVKRVPKVGWREDTADIEALALEQLDAPDLTAKLAPTNYRLARVRMCNLAGNRFAHFIYEDGGEEISFFVRLKGGALPGTPVVVSGRVVHADATAGYEVAGFQSEKLTVLIVSKLSHTKTLQLAGEAASRMA